MFSSSVFAEDGKHVPTIDELIKVKSVGSVRISPDGNFVAYTVRGADFEENAYITQIWLANVSSGDTFQLTSGKKSASNSSDRFAAISVGAGISNWATYYYNTDITPFTVNYLGDDPVDDPEVYQENLADVLHQKGQNSNFDPINF